MRDNMEQTEVLALAPEQYQLQQQQQQRHHHQQASLVGGGHFFHQTLTLDDATTTSSSVAHVKSEPHDDIDEFEISSQHYSSDTASENLQFSLGSDMSPGSSRSQDSVSPLVADNNNHITHSIDGFTHENFITSSKSPHNDEISLTPLKCPICGFQHQNRLEFTDHLREHCPSAAKIGKEEFNKCVMAQLTNSSTSSNHSNEEKHFDNFDRGIRIPCISSQGKVTTHHCKQCGAVFITKVDKWIHGRTHMRPEKILDCPTCEFCTELKQHLQYHLLNHSGSKPFKCEMCNYECVNKSMLNSHMKSHSDVYQFRCADCPYATKYCYTLKVHLRTRNHRHRMILNPDGTPNPDYIIDVYGTRRGPKSKSKTKTQKVKSENSPQPELAQSPYGLPSQLATLNQSHLFNPMNGLANIANFNAFREAGPVPSIFMNFPANQFFNHLSMAHSYAVNPTNAAQSNYPKNQISFNYMDHLRGKSTLSLDEVPTMQKNEEPDTDDERSVPLNLSTNCKSETPRHVEVTRYLGGDRYADHQEVSLPRTTGSSRRKGLARRVLKSETAEEMPEADLTDSPPTPPLSPPVSSDVDQKSKNSGDFVCRYCNISFGHEIMHLIHMTYHDDENPFKCKKCGIQTNESVSFFLHIVSYKH